MAEVKARPGIELRYRSAGEGRPIVLLHGFPVDGRMFDGQLSAAEVGRIEGRLIAVDMPGFGATPLPDPAPDVLTVEELAESVAGLIQREGWAPAVVGGVAIGAYVAIELAARHPELVAALVLMGPKPAPDSPSLADQRESTAQLALRDGSTVVADTLHAKPLGPQADGAVKAKMHKMIADADPRGIAALIRGIARRPDPSPAMAALQMPVQVIAGEKDPFSPLADVKRVAQIIPRASLVVIPGIGHMAPIEAQLSVTRALASFVRRLP
jgi:pimeloyl-ACP methyl ester carboxylesterase